MKNIITILLLILTTATWAQVEVGDVVTDKHKEKIEKTKDPRKKLKKYRKYYSKDSARYVKQLEKRAVTRMDSIGKVLKAKKTALEKGIPSTDKITGVLGDKVKVAQLDATQKVGLPSEKSMTADLPSLDQQEAQKKINTEVDQLIEENESLQAIEASQKVLKTHQADISKHTEGLKDLKLDSTGVTSYKEKAKDQAKKATSQLDQGEYAGELMDLKLDSTQVADYKKQGKEKAKTKVSEAEQKAAEKAGVGVLNEQQASLESVKSTPEEYQKLAEEYKDKGQLKQKAKKASREKAAEFFLANQDKLLGEQKKLGLLKNKYSSVLNSNDLSTAVKVNSLEGRSFRERLILGGDFQMVEAKPLVLVASPIIGYRFNKRLSAGLGANLRISQKQDNTTAQTAKKDGSDAQGGKAFVQYVLLKSFHAVAEYELTYTQVPATIVDEKTKEWVPGILLGIGKKFPIHAKVDASVSILYNLVYDAAKSPYNSPFVFRFGLQLSELALLKKK